MQKLLLALSALIILSQPVYAISDCMLMKGLMLLPHVAAGAVFGPWYGFREWWVHWATKDCSQEKQESKSIEKGEYILAPSGE